jgi:MFS family permease
VGGGVQLGEHAEAGDVGQDQLVQPRDLGGDRVRQQLAALLGLDEQVLAQVGPVRLVTGAVVFGADSAGAAFAPNPEILIACRALMGLGGATLLPAGLAIIGNLFHNPKQRSQAIGIFAATFAAGFAAGPGDRDLPIP